MNHYPKWVIPLLAHMLRHISYFMNIWLDFMGPLAFHAHGSMFRGGYAPHSTGYDHWYLFIEVVTHWIPHLDNFITILMGRLTLGATLGGFYEVVAPFWGVIHTRGGLLHFFSMLGGYTLDPSLHGIWPLTPFFRGGYRLETNLYHFITILMGRLTLGATRATLWGFYEFVAPFRVVHRGDSLHFLHAWRLESRHDLIPLLMEMSYLHEDLSLEICICGLTTS